MTDRTALSAQVAEIWQKFRPTMLARVGAVEDAATALFEGRLDLETRRLAGREAHKLAGSVGTFGFANATGLARSIELLLEGDEEIGPEDVMRLGDLTRALRREMDASPPSGPPGEEPPPAAPGRRIGG